MVLQGDGRILRTVDKASEGKWLIHRDLNEGGRGFRADSYGFVRGCMRAPKNAPTREARADFMLMNLAILWSLGGNSVGVKVGMANILSVAWEKTDFRKTNGVRRIV